MSAEPNGPAYRAAVRIGGFRIAVRGAGAARATAKDAEDGVGDDAGGD